ncbi:putative DNA polymerase [uncultured virus]|uniref:DNA-directed DNA polymerase n=1 Tax=uncultured virus TaxID=340016 RepID=A0A218MKK9_9VIRU|nr:putative DNA polymerase [uncultured virus]
MFNVNKIDEAKLIAIDTETYDPNLKTMGPGGFRKDGHVAGISISTDSGYTEYFPIGHEGGGNLNKTKVISFLLYIYSKRKKLVFANAMYDVEWLYSLDKRLTLTRDHRIYDVQTIEHLIDENKLKYSLDSLAKFYLRKSKYEVELEQAVLYKFGKRAKVKENLWRLHANEVSEYAKEDALLTLQIYQKQQERIKREEIESIVDFESRLIPVLFHMRKKGVRVDVDKAHSLYTELEKKQSEVQTMLNRLGGTEVNVWANASLKEAYDKNSIGYNYTAKGTPSFTASWLETQMDDVSQSILKVRKLDKIRNTFVKNMIIDKATNGRIYCGFNPMGTVTGRFSSQYPNLQQVPARDPELGPMIRSLFIPEEDCEWVCADYSQQEPRVLVHYASLKDMDTAIKVQDEFNKNEDTDFHQMVADMASIPRKQAKTINLGLFYGMGNKKLAAELGLDSDQAYELFNKYHDKVPFVKELSRQVSHVASTRGYIKTLLGRKRRFDMWEPRDSWGERAYSLSEAHSQYPKQELKRAYTHTAMNALIQGSSADITKSAMIKIYEAGLLDEIDLKLTVHDELDFSVEPLKQKCFDESLQIMKTCVDLKVPLKVDVEKGLNWGTIE